MRTSSAPVRAGTIVMVMLAVTVTGVSFPGKPSKSGQCDNQVGTTGSHFVSVLSYRFCLLIRASAISVKLVAFIVKQQIRLVIA